MTRASVPKATRRASKTVDSGQDETIKPQVIKVGPKGVITIPDENRRAMDVEPGKYLTAIQVGRSLILSPEINDFLAIAEQFQAKLTEAGVAGESFLEELGEAREDLFQQLYGELTTRKSKRGA